MPPPLSFLPLPLPVHPNAAVIQKLYEGLKALDAQAMASCYHPEATFSDPVFEHLEGDEIAAMWRMLCAGARGWYLEYRDIDADDHRGQARWVATYTFGPTQRQIHNKIDARFTFRDGLILRHEDHFGLWRWSRMALGPTGILLGWTPFVRNKIRERAKRALVASQTPGLPSGP